VAGDAPKPRQTIVTAFGHYASVRTGKWNYVRPWTALPQDRRGRQDLYDLEADPQELTNIVADLPEVVAELDAHLAEHLRLHAPLTRGSVGPGMVEGVETRPGMSFDALPALERG
jgi:arylsulfatase A-like enzyme